MTTTNDTSSTGNTEAAQYWNDHYNGACFLNNIRLVKTRQEPFLSVDVHVKQGKREQGSKTKTQRINANVVGSRATAIVNALLEKYDFTKGVKSESNPKGHPPISAFFVVGDLWADVYTSNVDQKPRAAMKGRLVSLHHVYVDNERFDTPDEFGESSADSSSTEVPREGQQSVETVAPEDRVVEAPAAVVDTAKADAPVIEETDSVDETDVAETELETYERRIAEFAESTLDSNCIELDSNDPMYKPFLRFLLSNGFIWSDNASAYVPKIVASAS